MSAPSLTLTEERLTAALGRPPKRGDDHLLVPILKKTEIEHVLRIGRETQTQVGVLRGPIRLDLSALRTFELDETSLLVQVGVGWTLGALEAELSRHGLLLGLSPAASMDRSLGALLAAPRGSEAMPRSGPATQLVYAVEALLADGVELVTRGAPRKAAGPELWQLLVGSRGALGIFVSATLRVERRPESRREAAWEFPNLPAATAGARTILLDGVRPLDLAVVAPALLVATFEGPAILCEALHQHANALAKRAGGHAVPHQPQARYRSSPSERRISLDVIHQVPSLPKEARLVGWHLGGATLLDPTTAYVPVAPSPMLLALKRRLDPNQHFVDF